LDSYQRANGAIKSEKTVPSSDHILVLIKNDILKHCKELLLLEASKPRGYATGREALSFIDQINGEFLNDFLGKCTDTESNAIFSAVFYELSAQMRISTRGKNLREKSYQEFLNRLSALTNDPRIFKILGNVVTKETMGTSSLPEENWRIKQFWELSWDPQVFFLLMIKMLFRISALLFQIIHTVTKRLSKECRQS